MNLWRNRLCGWEIKSGSGLCPVAGLGFSGVDASASSVTQLV
jgi:hypothetical protein